MVCCAEETCDETSSSELVRMRLERFGLRVGFADAQPRPGARKSAPAPEQSGARHGGLVAGQRRLVRVSSRIPLAESDAGPAWRLAVAGRGLWRSRRARCPDAAPLVLGATGGAGAGDVARARLSRPTAAG